jgi:regulator of sirC expression with transglutaminase-like and TPR domain
MSKHPFDLLMELESEHIRLDCAALHLARDRYPGLDVTHYLRVLDRCADEVADRRPGLAANLRYAAMHAVLVEQRHLTGNRRDYYAPENCYLHRVLESGVGIPITLSTVWVEVARRLKWPVSGVALPGHFIVRFDDPERCIFVDPFNDGRTLSVADCRRLMRQRFGDEIPFSRRFLRPVSSRGILARLLRNLRNAYLAANDLPRLASTLERMAAAEPENGRHLQDLAAVCCQRGDWRTAYTHLLVYLRRTPHAKDSEVVRQNLRQIRAALAALN